MRVKVNLVKLVLTTFFQFRYPRKVMAEIAVMEDGIPQAHNLLLQAEKQVTVGEDNKGQRLF